MRFGKSIRVTIEHGHANNFANDYSSTVFWYQLDPHAPFGALPLAEARRPREGDDPHDRAYRHLMGLRDRVLALWLQSIRGGTKLPEDLQQALKYEITQTYLRRDYAALIEQTDALGPRIDALLEKSKPAQ